MIFNCFSFSSFFIFLSFIANNNIILFFSSISQIWFKSKQNRAYKLKNHPTQLKILAFKYNLYSLLRQILQIFIFKKPGLW